jgi:hypothetical protein
MAPQDESARKRVRVSKGPAVLSALLSGVTIEDIAKTEGIKVERVQKLLLAELRKRWIAPAQDYALLQIARLEAIAKPLKEKAKDGDLPYVDRLLKCSTASTAITASTSLRPFPPPRPKTCASNW